MNINRNNYEAFFIDYIDGNLSAEMTAELFLFLETNPDLKEELEGLESFSLPENEEQFPSRDALKRGAINAENLSWYLAASTEHDLSAVEQKQLDEYLLKNPDAKNEKILFQLARLHPGDEVYPDKNKLKQPVPFLFGFTRTFNYAAAAMLLLSLIAGSYFYFTSITEKQLPNVAEVQTWAQTESNHTQPELTAGNSAETTVPSENSTGTSGNEVNNSTEQNSGSDHATQSDQNKQKTDRPKRIVPVETRTAELPLTAEITIENKNTDSLKVIEVAPAEEQVAQNTSVNEEQYMSVWEAIRNGTENNLRKLSGQDDDALASADPDAKNPVRLVNVLGKGIEKVSNDKVTVDASYNEEGKLSAFQFAAGKFKIERSKGF